MTATFDSIPVVDIADLVARDASEARRIAAAHALTAAAERAGFAYVAGHGISQALSARLLDAARGYFSQDRAAKDADYIGFSTCHRGYVPPGEETFYGGGRDVKEAFDLALDLPADDPDHVAGNPMLGPNRWPDLPGFQTAVSAYYDAVLALGNRLLEGLALGLGLAEDHFVRHVSKPPSQLRLIRYPGGDPAADAPGIGAHTDYEMLTVLSTTAPGLEVQNGRGDWIDAPPVPGALVVNIGDMLEAWTNGRLTATAHRVRPLAGERYSFPLFCSVDYHTAVAPDSAFVSADRPPAYRGVIAGEHLFAQTVQTFAYLRAKHARGEISLPDGAFGLSSFGPAPAGRAPSARASR